MTDDESRMEDDEIRMMGDDRMTGNEGLEGMDRKLIDNFDISSKYE